MVFTTSLIVNISIKKNFELYIDNNIKEAGDRIVVLVEELYAKGILETSELQQSIVENYLGNFTVTLLKPDKSFVWGKTEEDFVEELNKK